ncbi:porin [Psychrobacter frigidicola]|uniref:Porin n=1 Tax=Psychrobacter frigidicola TaxID=45611 RepID=A0A5C7A4N7_9GAMM|nr:porin [Psychrobacter frigidicola]TXD98391.1 porin [Psychrobacter frigidicola]
MKKLLLASAIAALSVSAAQAAPTFYGKAFVTADYVNAESDMNLRANERADKFLIDYDENTVEINSHASRLGLKGSETLSANTDLVYQLEYGIGIDGDNNTFKSRDTYLGVVNKDFGQFRVGRNSSVLGYVNNVTLTEGYWDNLGNSKLESENDLRALNMLDDSRQSNSIVWIAPKYNNLPLELALQYASDENFVDSKNGYGASLMFDQGTGFTAGLAYSKDMDVRVEKADLLDNSNPLLPKIMGNQNYRGDVIRGTVSADLAKYVTYPVKVGVMYQQTDYDFNGSDKEKGLVVSGEMGLTNFAKPASVYLQYNKTDNLNGFGDAESDQIVLGGKYMFKKNMIGHAYVGQNSADYVRPGKIDTVAVVNGKEVVTDTRYGNYKSDIDVFAVGGGLEYKF